MLIAAWIFNYFSLSFYETRGINSISFKVGGHALSKFFVCDDYIKKVLKGLVTEYGLIGFDKLGLKVYD